MHLCNCLLPQLVAIRDSKPLSDVLNFDLVLPIAYHVGENQELSCVTTPFDQDFLGPQFDVTRPDGLRNITERIKAWRVFQLDQARASGVDRDSDDLSAMTHTEQEVSCLVNSMSPTHHVFHH